MNLTLNQRDALVRMLDVDPDAVRGGMGMDGRYRAPAGVAQVNSGTASSLVGHGLAALAQRPTGAPRGTYYRLTQLGLSVARRTAADRQAAGW